MRRDISSELLQCAGYRARPSPFFSSLLPPRLSSSSFENSSVADSPSVSVDSRPIHPTPTRMPVESTVLAPTRGTVPADSKGVSSGYPAVSPRLAHRRSKDSPLAGSAPNQHAQCLRPPSSPNAIPTPLIKEATTTTPATKGDISVVSPTNVTFPEPTNTGFRPRKAPSSASI